MSDNPTARSFTREEAARIAIEHAIHHLCEALQQTERKGTAARILETLRCAKEASAAALFYREGEPVEGHSDTR